MLPFREYDKKNFINLDGVTKFYQQGKIRVLVLDELNLKVKQGEVIVIFGPSGSGKTTLLNLIGGLDVPNSGKITVGDLNIHDLSIKELDAYRRFHVGFIFQCLNLYPSLTVTENVFHQAQLVYEDSEEELLKHVFALLDIMGISSRKDYLPERLSGGEQQRVAIAMALIKNPSIIIADEPTGELDASNTQNIINLFADIKASSPRTTFIIVSHNYAWQEIADHVYYLENGKIKRQVGIAPPIDNLCKTEFPDIPHLIDALQCPTCSSFNVQFIIDRSNELQVGKKYVIISGIVKCNDCSNSTSINAKILKKGE